MKLKTLICAECEGPFEFAWINGNHPKTCLSQCKQRRANRLRTVAGRLNRGPRDCLVCGTSFTPRTRSDAKFCSPRCNSMSHRLEHVYNLSLAEYGDLLATQDGKCAACWRPLEGTPYVDHCHETGIVRGLLHSKCNTILGFADEDPDALTAMARYLEKWLNYVSRASAA